MPRRGLDLQLQELTRQMVQLGTLVDQALAQILQALEQKNLALCTQVIEADSIIDALRYQIEGQAFRLLTLQQPLGSRDLRFLTATLAIAGDLERAGDGAAGIGILLLRMLSLEETTESLTVASSVPDDPQMTEAAVSANIVELGQEARRVLQVTMRAFQLSDVALAKKIWQEDDVVDVQYHMVRHTLLTMLSGIHAIPTLQQDPTSMQRITYLLWIAHKLERVADHCTNICERTVFSVEGDGTIRPEEPV